MPVRLKAVRPLAPPGRLGMADLTGPYVEPFVGRENPPLSAVELSRRVEAEAAKDAVVELRFDDGSPAIVSRRVGQGSVLWWGFSPAADWATWSGWSSSPSWPSGRPWCCSAATGRAELLAWPVGRAARRAGTPRRRRDRPAALRPRPARRGGPAHGASPAADQIGQWTVDISAGAVCRSLGFSVNAPAEESDLALLTPTQIEHFFAPACGAWPQPPRTPPGRPRPAVSA